MYALYTVADIKQIEATALSNLPAATLMQRAGQASAQFTLRILEKPAHTATILVLVGPGKNGGDALEAATSLAKIGAEVVALLILPPLPATSHLLTQALQAGVHFMPPEQFDEIGNTPWDIVLDGLFGIGLNRALKDEWRILVQVINTLSCPILALDVPSGLDADTGIIVGDIAIQASHTITFIAAKAGLYTNDGPDYAGIVEVANLMIAAHCFPLSNKWLNHPALFNRYLQPRRRNSHKGSFGTVTVIGGANGMTGAPTLAARAALQCGAGRVLVGYAGQTPCYDNMQPELMCRSASDFEFSSTVLVVGTGLGVDRQAYTLLARALEAPCSLVLDADALHLLAQHPQFEVALAQRQYPILITPHPLEAARLLGINTDQIQADRIASACKLAQRFHAVVILKGAGTLIAHPDGTTVVNTNGNPALATAGSGDVLSGICGALLAQGWPHWQAALAAVWLHGEAADQLAIQGRGPIGLTAGELIPEIRRLINQLVHHR